MADRPDNTVAPAPGEPNYDILVQLDGVTFSNDQFGAVTGIGLDETDDDTLVVNELSAFDRGGDSNVTWTLWLRTGVHVVAPTDTVNGHRWGNFGTFMMIGSDGTQIQVYAYGFADGQVLLSASNVGTTTGINAFADRHFAESGQYQPFVLNLSGAYTDIDLSAPIYYENDASAFCFAEGTRIETPAGPVAVEDLAEGQLVLTASGVARPVKWIGQLVSRPARHRRPWEVQPVCIKPHAFGADMPAREVRLSPGHAVYVDGVLVPVGHLVNGATIVQEEVERIRYFHVELETHDLLVAEGVPCESYLDDGNRQSFRNAGEFTAIHGRLDPKSWDDACAPLVAAGPQLVEIQEKLHARAGKLGWVKSEQPELRIVADGVEIVPLHCAGNRYWFAVPTAATLELRSGSGVLAQLVPGIGDGRRLGVAVAEIRVDGETIDLDDAAFGRGFYPAERHEAHGWRWTDGNAALTRTLEASAMVEVTLAMVAPHWVRPTAALRVVA